MNLCNAFIKNFLFLISMYIKVNEEKLKKMTDEQSQNYKEIARLNNDLSSMKIKNTDLNKKQVPSKLTKETSRPILPPLQITYVEWKEFEFVTKKTGAYGPAKQECISYYAEK